MCDKEEPKSFNPAKDSWATRRQMLAIIILREYRLSSDKEDFKRRLKKVIE